MNGCGDGNCGCRGDCVVLISLEYCCYAGGVRVVGDINCITNMYTSLLHEQTI